MANRELVAEIHEVKRRGYRGQGTHYLLRSLRGLWEAFPQKEPPIADFFPIRAVTLLEVFTRGWIATLVDHGPPYNERAVKLVKNLKIDYDLLRAVHGKTITLGDLMAHSVALNSFGQMLGAFDDLLGERCLPRLGTVVDRWDVEVWKRPSQPIIKDTGEVAAALSRLFEARHILVHEYPKATTYDAAEVSAMLDSAGDFACAAHGFLTEMLYGRVPLTQLDMNDRASEELATSNTALDAALAELSTAQDEHGLALLETAQSLWREYREAQGAFRADAARGGSLAPLLRLQEMRDLTEQRLQEVKIYLGRGEGEI